MLYEVITLEGLSDGEITAAAQKAEAAGIPGKYMIPILNTTQQPALQSLKNRATRQKLFEASWNRAEKGDANDTRKMIERQAELRAEKAKLMGFNNYARITSYNVCYTKLLRIHFLKRL